MRKALKRDNERIYNARIQNNVIQGEKENIVWVSVSHSVVLGTFTKELSGVICENTEFFRLSQDLLNQEHHGTLESAWLTDLLSVFDINQSLRSTGISRALA